MTRTGLAACGLALWLAVVACASAPRGWEIDDLEARHPAVEEVDDHALEYALPYFALGDHGVALFLCRWAVEAPIAVWLPPRASSEEKLLLERALAAWEGAGLGVRFQSRTWEEAPPTAGIVFEWTEASDDENADAASTIADCAIPTRVPGPDDEAFAEALEAELEYASIHLTRERRDALGRRFPLTDAELMGAAIHELGHALGFAGHVENGPSVLSRRGQTGKTRRWGERVAAGEPLEAPSLAALYAAPTGVRVGWLPLEDRQLEPVQALAIVARHRDMRGPWARVGDRSARILWRSDAGPSAAAIVLDWPEVLRDPTQLEPRLNRRARQLLKAASRS